MLELIALSAMVFFVGLVGSLSDDDEPKEEIKETDEKVYRKVEIPVKYRGEKYKLSIEVSGDREAVDSVFGAESFKYNLPSMRNCYFPIYSGINFGLPHDTFIHSWKPTEFLKESNKWLKI